MFEMDTTGAAAQAGEQEARERAASASTSPSGVTPSAAAAAAAAPGQTRALRTSRRVTTTIFLVNGTAIGIWAAHIPLIKEAHQLSEARLSIVLLGFALGAIATMIMSGWLSARYGSGRVTALAGVAFCAALPMPSLAPGLAALFVAAVLLGGCNGAMDVAMNAHATTLERAWHGPIMSSFHAFFSLGGLLGAAISSTLIARGFGAQTNMPLAAIVLVAIVFAMWRVLWHDDAPTSPLRDAQTAMRGQGAAGHDGQAEPATPKIALPSKGLVRLGAIAFCAAIAEGAMVDWTGVYLKTVLGAAAAFAAGGFAACSLSMTIGRLTGDRVISRLGRRETMIASGIVAAIGLACAVLAGTPLTAALGFGLAGFGLANIIPIVFADAGHANPAAPGIGVATVATMGYAGFLLGPPMIGFTAGLIGLRLALVMLVASAILITLLGLRSSPAHATHSR